MEERVFKGLIFEQNNMCDLNNTKSSTRLSGYEQYRTNCNSTLSCRNLITSIKQIDQEMQELEQARQTKSRLDIRQTTPTHPPDNSQSALQFRSTNRHHTTTISKGSFQPSLPSHNEQKQNMARLSFRKNPGTARVRTEVATSREEIAQRLALLRAEVDRIQRECQKQVRPIGRKAVSDAFRTIKDWLI